MNVDGIVAWGLVAAAFAVGWSTYGWPGVALAATVVAFWLLLQFSAAMRVMRRAAERPLGHVDSAAAFEARLRRGMTMMKIVSMTGSLGRQVAEAPPTWVWSDPGGVTVTLVLDGARLAHWRLARDPEPPVPATPAQGPQP